MSKEELLNKEKVFYFIVPVWGEPYADILINITLPSCLSENNIPRLKNLKESKFIFVSDRETFSKISQSAIFNLLQKYIQAEFIQLNFKQKISPKHTHQTIGYMQGTLKAQEAQACCIYLTADMVVSDGTINFLQKLVNEGRGMVFLPGPRVNKAEFLTEIKGYREDLNKSNDEPLTISSRKLVEIGMTCFHEEFTSYNVMSNEFTLYPQSITYPLANNKGFLIKGFHQHLLLVDLELLPEKIDFNEFSTIDGTFVEDNLISTNYLYYESDSDNMLVYSLTDKDDEIGGRFKVVRKESRFDSIQNALFNMVHTNNAHKMHQFAFINTYVLHKGDLDENYIECNRIMKMFSEKIIKYNPLMLNEDVREFKAIKNIKVVNFFYSYFMKLIRFLGPIIKRTPLYKHLV